ncbi:unnamed protein product, partial [Staurois parvus]
MGPLCPCPNSKKPMKKHVIGSVGGDPHKCRDNEKTPGRQCHGWDQGQTDKSWGPRAIGDHGAPVCLPKLKKAYEKGTRGISWGPLLTPLLTGSVSKWSVCPWLGLKPM